MSTGLILHPDGCQRCWWPGTDPLYVAYHDTEWGVPEHDDRALYEKLILDGFQAGLSWITILRRRDGFRRAFAGFEPEAIARFGPREVEALMQDAGIIRNRAKIEATIRSARAWLAIQEGGPGFSAFLWDFVDGRPLQPRPESRADIPTESEASRKMSKALKAQGFGFCGPTIVYAFMQAVGMINDHLVDCCRHAPCAALPGPCTSPRELGGPGGTA
ncbi:DNA-3-methyladenine glycosylase I [Methylobacterium platani]|uniref:DNA-3-methyladenine glycosylase I n=1 Tax=Methylobacterium platani TaxID=427683 RepID=A0A179SFY6_9HYPH|nr:DNA-3-methyladenine glycosylase I [Methylobacterium platani]OAS26787.1 DNA-3-methyladenine glycosylase [Methylobacterium platani]